MKLFANLKSGFQKFFHLDKPLEAAPAQGFAAPPVKGSKARNDPGRVFNTPGAFGKPHASDRPFRRRWKALDLITAE